MGKVDDFIKECNENPATVNYNVLNDFSSDELAELSAKIRPYQGLKGMESEKSGVYKAAIVSFTNNKQNYLTKLVVTAFSGFLFHVQKEYEIPEREREVTLEGDNEQLQPFNAELDSVQHMLMRCNVMTERIKTYTKEANDLELKALDANLLIDKKTATQEQLDELINLNKTVRKYRSDIAELKYLLSIALAEMGKDASKRVERSVIECNKYQGPEEAAQTVRKHPSPNSFKRRLMLSNAETQKIISKFLDRVMQFNVSDYISPSLKPDNFIDMKKVIVNEQTRTVHEADTSRLSYEALLSSPVIPEKEHLPAVIDITRTQEAFNSVKFMLRPENQQFREIMSMVWENQEKFQMYLSPIGDNEEVLMAAKKVPAADIYYKFNRYFSDNYEAIREIVNTIYDEKPEIECVIGLHETLQGTEEQIRKQLEEYAVKNNIQEELFTIMNGHYTFVAPWRKNRDASVVYNRNNEILKRIDERNVADRLLGTKILNGRVERKKMENIEKEGPDAPGLSQWIQTNSVSGKGSQPPLLSNEIKMRMDMASKQGLNFKELEAIMEEDTQIEKLNSISTIRPLTDVESRKLEYHMKTVKRMRKELETPDDMIMSNVVSIDREGKVSEDVIHFETEDSDELKKRAADGKPLVNVRSLK